MDFPDDITVGDLINMLKKYDEGLLITFVDDDEYGYALKGIEEDECYGELTLKLI